MRTLAAFALLTPLLACGNDYPPPPPPPVGVTPPAPGVNPGVVPQPVAPQPVAPGTPGTPGLAPIVLAPGFIPDPHVVRGSSGGAIQASNLNPQCVGWISQQPNHLFTATGPFSTLRFVVSASSDTTLVVQQPNGTYLCNDDADGTNPIVQGSMQAGAHRIWVGSYSRGERVAYTLGISELSSTTSASLGGPGVPPVNPPVGNAAQLDTAGTQSNFAQISLAPGFVPDPHVVTGTSGGSIDASTVTSACRGYIARVP
ncbi:MAG: hypothetical protein AAGE52_36180, partial [Myxococcota bacterium]